MDNSERRYKLRYRFVIIDTKEERRSEVKNGRPQEFDPIYTGESIIEVFKIHAESFVEEMKDFIKEESADNE